MSVQPQEQTLTFEAEVKQLLKLVAHSLYSNKEIFLRELISNASDANDKLRYAALSNSSLYENDSELKIWVDFDKENRIITVRDNGIGMNRDEVVENIGTIAKSGTRAFRDLLSSDKAKDSQLIGQFGVGFYSAFVVADKVVIKTRRAGVSADQGVHWESDGEGSYTIKNCTKETRGTEIILHLREDQSEFLDAYRLRTIITKYSDHILFPILMKKVPDPSEKEAKPVEWETVNKANALWILPKEQIKDEEYKELYKHIAHDFEDPLCWAHNKVEGAVEYTSLLYVPARAPFDLYYREAQRGLKLYVKRVFIMDDAEQLMPLYLRFVKGVIDCNDLPLNISRELLQSNKTVETIRKGCTKRVISMLEKLAEDDKDKYSTFWKEFGSVLKEGPAEDSTNKDRLAKLLRFSSTKNDSDVQEASLSDYVSRMAKDQDKIYYLVADNYLAAKNSPLLEVFRKKNIEVLLMYDRVDEWLMSNLREFEGKSFQSISQGSLDLGKLEDTETKEQKEKAEQEFTDIVKEFKDVLKDKVKEVRLTYRLTDSPACVVFDNQDLTGHMQRILKAAGQELPETKPILELNPEHAIVARLKTLQDKKQLTRWADLLLNQSLLAEGESLQDPAGFVKELNELLLELAR